MCMIRFSPLAKTTIFGKFWTVWATVSTPLQTIDGLHVLNFISWLLHILSYLDGKKTQMLPFFVFHILWCRQLAAYTIEKV